MKPGHGDVLLAEGDVEVAEDEQRLIEEFRRQLDEGMWAAVPTSDRGGHHEATMVRDFAEIPRDAERVIFFPRAAGGCRDDRRPLGRVLVALVVLARDARFGPDLRRWLRAAARARHRRAAAPAAYDPGRERRAERKARELLRSVVGEEDYEMYRDARLHPRRRRLGTPTAATATCSIRTGRSSPSRSESGELLNEYCVALPRRATRRLAPPARLRRRARQVDGAARATSGA